VLRGFGLDSVICLVVFVVLRVHDRPRLSFQHVLWGKVVIHQRDDGKHSTSIWYGADAEPVCLQGRVYTSRSWGVVIVVRLVSNV